MGKSARAYSLLGSARRLYRRVREEPQAKRESSSVRSAAAVAAGERVWRSLEKEIRVATQGGENGGRQRSHRPDQPAGRGGAQALGARSRGQHFRVGSVCGPSRSRWTNAGTSSTNAGVVPGWIRTRREFETRRPWRDTSGRADRAERSDSTIEVDFLSVLGLSGVTASRREREVAALDGQHVREVTTRTEASAGHRRTIGSTM